MSLLRNDLQVALQWLHGWAQETASHFRFVSDHEIGQRAVALCGELSAEREQLADQLAAAIRDTGDLPAGPDPDREAVLQLQEELATVLDQHGADAMLEHCRSREEALLNQVAEEAVALEDSQYQSLLAACKDSALEAVKRLQGLASG